MSKFITVKYSNIPTEIAIAKTYLEDRGIRCLVKDELTNQVHPVAIGGIKLQVHEDDVVCASELLIEGGFAAREDFEISESSMRMVKMYEKVSNFFKKKG